VAGVLKKGMYDPANEDKDMFEVLNDELNYVAKKLGISWQQPPSN